MTKEQLFADIASASAELDTKQIGPKQQEYLLLTGEAKDALKAVNKTAAIGFQYLSKVAEGLSEDDVQSVDALFKASKILGMISDTALKIIVKADLLINRTDPDLPHNKRKAGNA